MRSRWRRFCTRSPRRRGDLRLEPVAARALARPGGNDGSSWRWGGRHAQDRWHGTPVSPPWDHDPHRSGELMWPPQPERLDPRRWCPRSWAARRGCWGRGEGGRAGASRLRKRTAFRRERAGRYWPAHGDERHRRLAGCGAGPDRRGRGRRAPLGRFVFADDVAALRRAARLLFETRVEQIITERAAGRELVQSDGDDLVGSAAGARAESDEGALQCRERERRLSTARIVASDAELIAPAIARGGCVGCRPGIRTASRSRNRRRAIGRIPSPSRRAEMAALS